MRYYLGLAFIFCLLLGTRAQASTLKAFWTLADSTTGVVDTINARYLTNTGSVTFQTIGGFACAGKFTTAKFLSSASGGLMTDMTAASSAYSLQWDVYETATPSGIPDIFGSWHGTGAGCTGVSNANIGTSSTITWESAGASCQDLASVATVSNGAWHRIILTFDGTTKRIYVDGSLSSSVVTDASWGTISSYYLGVYLLGTYSLNGYLKSVAFWSGAVCTGGSCAGYDPPTPTPTPTITNTYTITLTATPSFTASPTLTATPTPTITPTFTVSSTVTVTVTPGGPPGGWVVVNGLVLTR